MNARLRPLGRGDYEVTRRRMREFTEARAADTPDEVWLIEHAPVFTLGQAARDSHLLAPGPIPTVRVERGGQVTYHGPGQLVGYVLFDLRRRRMRLRDLVDELESAMIDCLSRFEVAAMRRHGAPGVYLATPEGPGAKIGALGLKVSHGCTYHGIALNVAMDLEPFSRINPCGYPGLEVADIRGARAQAGLPPLSDNPMEEVAAVLGPLLATL